MDRNRLRRVEITNILTNSGNLSRQLMTGDQGIARWQPAAHDQLIRAAEPCGPHANEDFIGPGLRNGHLLKL